MEQAAAQAEADATVTDGLLNSHGWAYAHNARPKPEPWCDPDGNNCAAKWNGGSQALWPSGTTEYTLHGGRNGRIPPLSAKQFDNTFYEVLCGPGSTAYILNTYAHSKIADRDFSGWGLTYTDEGTGPPERVYVNFGTGYYGLLMQAANSELNWTTHLVGTLTATFNTKWGREAKFLGMMAPKLGIPGYGFFAVNPHLSPTDPILHKDFHDALSYNVELLHGAMMTGVDTSNLPGWNGQSYDHFVSVSAVAPNHYNSGTKSTGELKYADTAVSCYVYSGAEVAYNDSTGQCGSTSGSDSWNNGVLHLEETDSFLTFDVMGPNSEKVWIGEGEGDN